MTTTTTTAWGALQAAHPHHADRIARESANLVAGTIVTINDTGSSGFFTGLTNGSRAVITRTALVMSVQSIPMDSAHLAISDRGDVTPVDPTEWTREEIKAAASAASEYAKILVEHAYCSANGLLGAMPTDEAALGNLREAKRYRDLAFALQILDEYHDRWNR